MHWIDWLIMLLPLATCGFIAVYSRKYVRSVADFMAGGRNAGRYLICAARSEQGSGAVVFVAAFQAFYQSGFGLQWWSNISLSVGLLVSISGYVVYRYRETRALSLGQFFEMRYSRRFRLVTGMLGFFAGILNFGIIPVLGAKCMVYLLELPPVIHPFSLAVPTYLILMAIFLSLCVLTTTTGGQISVLLTDCAEGMFSQLFYTLIGIVVLLAYFKWNSTRAMLLDTAPTKSLVNPFDAFGIADFNLWMVLMGVISSNLYRTIAWQNCHAFNSSAASAHESRMGGILGRWRLFAVTTMVSLLAVCAMTYLHDPHGSAAVQGVIVNIKDAATRDQMRMPTALSQFLPPGIKGMLLSVCVMGIISGDGIHLHSWGSIFIQDVVLPLRKKPLTPQQHLKLLRWSIVGVAVWAYLFGAIFPQTQFVYFWWAVTEAVFVGGAGVCVVAGLYWSRGTTTGAWTALVIGSTMAVGGIVADLYCRTFLPAGKDWIVLGIQLSHNHTFVLNGIQVSFFSGIVACLSYGIVSLLTCTQPINMDKLLNRGIYAVEGEHQISKQKTVNWLHRIVGIDEQFTRSDRWVTLSIFWWSIFWFAFFVVVSVGYLLMRRPGHDQDYNRWWADYSLITGIHMPLLIGAATTVWFTIGCWRDIWVFFHRLNSQYRDNTDDGSISSPMDFEPSMETASIAPGNLGMPTPSTESLTLETT